MKKSQILIIDDDAGIRKTLADILKAKGYRTLQAEGGAVGIALLRSNPVDLVLTDLGLPDTSGIEILDIVRAEFPHTQTIILTGSATLDSAVKATNRGAFSYLMKPYDLDSLLLHIQRAIEKQRIEEDLRISKRMIEDVSQGITDSILLLSMDLKIVWANKAALAQKGLTLEDMVGKPCHLIHHHRETRCDSAEEPCPVDELPATGGSRTVQHIHYDEVGNRFHVEITVYPVRDEAGEITGLVHVSRDITERVQMEEMIADKVRQLEASLARVKQLEGIIPICMYCKKIRDDAEHWQQMEEYISQHSEADFSHGICPECFQRQIEEIEAREED